MKVGSGVPLHGNEPGARQQVLQPPSGNAALQKAVLPPTQSTALRAGCRGCLERGALCHPTLFRSAGQRSQEDASEAVFLTGGQITKRKCSWY